MAKLLREILTPVLDESESGLYTGFDCVGDIAILKIPEELYSKRKIIGEAVLARLKQVRVVLMQRGSVSGEFRTRELEHLAGEQRTTTVHREHGCAFMIDLSKVYFSARLSTERMRIAQQVAPGEKILNMFAGIGSFSIVIAKTQKRCNVTDIELNPAAHMLAKENAKLNKLSDRILDILGDARSVLRDGFGDRFDRVLMPLPERSDEFLGSAIPVLKPEGGWLHFYTHLRSHSPREARMKGMEELDGRILGKGRSERSRVVTEVGPGWFQVVVDARIDPVS